jgi:predicted ATPase
MGIKRLKLEKFTAFEWTEMEFTPGINIFLGANGTGKSHALKVLYALAHVPMFAGDVTPDALVTANLKGCFKPEGNSVSRLVRAHDELDIAEVTVDYALGGIEMWLGSKDSHDVTLSPGTEHFPTVFIPSRELLSMYEGFVGAYSKRELSFDQTYFDACLALNAAPLLGAGAELAATLTASLEEAIGGKVVLDGERFSVTTEESRFEAHLVGEGLRKLAALVRLIQNGSISKGSVLFWDEPESNLNPRLTTLVADLVVKLAEHGVQVFLATHDYLLSSRLSLLSEYNQVPKAPIRLFAFYRKLASAPVTVESGSTLADLPEDPIVDEFAKHYDFERQLFAGKTDVK